MEEAMANHLVLEVIAKHVPYRDLKTMREINTVWSKAVKQVFRERSVVTSWKSISNVEGLLQLEAGLLNQELVAKVNLKLLLDCYSDREFHQLVEALQNIPEWFTRVKELRLNGYNSKELNRFLTYMLYCMRNLEKIEWEYMRYESLPFHGQDRIPAHVVLPAVPTDAEFSLTSVKIAFSAGKNSQFETPLNPYFLWYCKKVKCFDATVNESLRAFVEFLNAWRTMNRTPQMRYSCIKLDVLRFDFSDADSWIDGIGRNPKRVFREAVIQFINLNQPSSICTGSGFLDLDFADRYDQVSHEWTTALASGLDGKNVRHVKLAVPVEDNQGTCFPNWCLQRLCQVPAFSMLNELTLRIDLLGSHWVGEEQLPIFPVQTLNGVTLLTISIESFKWQHLEDPSFFSEKIAPFLPNVTSIYLKATCTSTRFSWFGGPCLSLVGIFQGLKEFQKLQELTFNLVAYQVAPVGAQGSFANLGVLEGLKRLNIRIKGYEGRHKRMMVSLFAGYEPHVELNLEYGTTSSYRVIKLSVPEFKAAMKVYDVGAVNKVIKFCAWEFAHHACNWESSEDED